MLHFHPNPAAGCSPADDYYLINVARFSKAQKLIPPTPLSLKYPLEGALERHKSMKTKRDQERTITIE
jgi:hypothetical protein